MFALLTSQCIEIMAAQGLNASWCCNTAEGTITQVKNNNGYRLASDQANSVLWHQCRYSFNITDLLMHRLLSLQFWQHHSLTLH
ncbi:hypothetical protein Gasu2_16440 [Galdieria sulphuraria]|nr:hypothetical protein Gasu2_16440 [Galdieria sulphuraria]